MNLLLLDIRKISTTEIDGKLFWNGEYEDAIFTVPGTKCTPIKPNIDPNTSNNLPGHYFEKQLIQDMGVHLALSNR